MRLQSILHCDLKNSAVAYAVNFSSRRMRLQSFLQKFQQKLTDPEVFVHVILLNFGVFAARGVPPDPHGDVKGSVKKIKNRIFKKVDSSIHFETTLGSLPGAILATMRQLFLKRLIRARI